MTKSKKSDEISSNLNPDNLRTISIPDLGHFYYDKIYFLDDLLGKYKIEIIDGSETKEWAGEYYTYYVCTTSFMCDDKIYDKIMDEFISEFGG